jgi:hypothetical protein
MDYRHGVTTVWAIPDQPMVGRDLAYNVLFETLLRLWSLYFPHLGPDEDACYLGAPLVDIRGGCLLSGDAWLHLEDLGLNHFKLLP